MSEVGGYRRVLLSGGAPETLLPRVSAWLGDVGRDGRVLFVSAKGQAEAFDPSDGKTQTLGAAPGPIWEQLEWSSDEHSVAYMLDPRKANDPKAGLWVSDFKNPPRQIFRGWVVAFARGPANEIYFLQGQPDLSAALWKVDWHGQGLTQTSWTVPILFQANYYHTVTDEQFAVSPDGRHLAFTAEQVLEENIGMIEDVR